MMPQKGMPAAAAVVVAEERRVCLLLQQSSHFFLSCSLHGLPDSGCGLPCVGTCGGCGHHLGGWSGRTVGGEVLQRAIRDQGGFASVFLPHVFFRPCPPSSLPCPPDPPPPPVQLVYHPKSKEMEVTACKFFGAPGDPARFPVQSVSFPYGGATVWAHPFLICFFLSFSLVLSPSPFLLSLQSALKTYSKYSYLKVHGHVGYFVLDRSDGAHLEEDLMVRVLSIGK